MDIGKKIKELASPRGSPRKSWRPQWTVQGIYFPAGTGSHLPVHCDIDGHFAVPGHNRLRIFSGRAGRSDCISKWRLFWENWFWTWQQDRMDHTERSEKYVEPIRLTLKPGGLTYRDLPHEGEEFGYVLKGSIKIHIGHKSYTAKKGESFYFTPHSEHYIEAFGTSGAVILWVSTPPNF